MTSAYNSSDSIHQQTHYGGGHRKRRPQRSRLSRKDKFLIALIVIAVLGKFLLSFGIPGKADADFLKKVTVPEWISVQLIDVDGASRRGKELKEFNDIVVHYVGNPGTIAQQNRDYFNSSDSNVSSHFVIGLEGEIIQCVPLWEISSASNHRNSDTISIEVCHPDSTGQFTDASRRSLIRLCAWLCRTGDLSSSHIIRHYDVTGKRCPLYYVDHEDQWKKLKKEIQKEL